jgi:hypothetical protein
MIDKGLEQAVRLLRQECCHHGNYLGIPCCSWTVAALDVEQADHEIARLREALELIASCGSCGDCDLAAKTALEEK